MCELWQARQEDKLMVGEVCAFGDMPYLVDRVFGERGQYLQICHVSCVFFIEVRREEVTRY